MPTPFPTNWYVAPDAHDYTQPYDYEVEIEGDRVREEALATVSKITGRVMLGALDIRLGDYGEDYYKAYCVADWSEADLSILVMTVGPAFFLGDLRTLAKTVPLYVFRTETARDIKFKSYLRTHGKI